MTTNPMVRMENPITGYGEQLTVATKDLTQYGQLEDKPTTREEKIQYLESHEMYNEQVSNNIKITGFFVLPPVFRRAAEWYQSTVGSEFWLFAGDTAVQEFQTERKVNLNAGGRQGGHLLMTYNGQSPVLDVTTIDYDTDEFDTYIAPRLYYEQTRKTAVWHGMNEWRIQQDTEYGQPLREDLLAALSDTTRSMALIANNIFHDLDKFRRNFHSHEQTQERSLLKMYDMRNTPPKRYNGIWSWDDEDLDEALELVWSFDVFTHNVACVYMSEVVYHLATGISEFLRENGNAGFVHQYDDVEYELDDPFFYYLEACEKLGFLEEVDDAPASTAYLITDAGKALLTVV